MLKPEEHYFSADASEVVDFSTLKKNKKVNLWVQNFAYGPEPTVFLQPYLVNKGRERILRVFDFCKLTFSAPFDEIILNSVTAFLQPMNLSSEKKTHFI